VDYGHKKICDCHQYLVLPFISVVNVLIICPISIACHETNYKIAGICVSVCHCSCCYNFESNLITLCTVIWDRKTKIEFIRGQYSITPTSISIFTNFHHSVMHFQWDGPNTAV